MRLNKKNAEETAKPASFLILLGVLKGYLKNPLWFLIRSKISFRTFKKKIDSDLPADFIETAGFLAWLYLRLKERVGQEDAFEILRAAVLTSGLAVQQATFRNVESGRTFENLKRFQQQANREGSTRLNTMEIVEASERRYEFRVTRCLFYELFDGLGVPELTTIFCSIDNAIFNSYLPEKLVFHRNGIDKTLVSGNSYCEFVIENRAISLKEEE